LGSTDERSGIEVLEYVSRKSMNDVTNVMSLQSSLFRTNCMNSNLRFIDVVCAREFQHPRSVQGKLNSFILENLQRVSQVRKKYVGVISRSVVLGLNEAGVATAIETGFIGFQFQGREGRSIHIETHNCAQGFEKLALV
jgi:N-acetylmuramoyl-L-alanine amidase